MKHQYLETDSLDATSLIDVATAASLLGVAPSMVRRLIHERRLTFVKVGRHVRIRRSDLELLIVRGTHAATAVNEAHQGGEHHV